MCETEKTSGIIKNDVITLEFFDQLRIKISDSKKPKYTERLAKVTTDILSKLGQQAIHPEVYQQI